MKLIKPLVWAAIFFVLAACSVNPPAPAATGLPAPAGHPETAVRKLVGDFGKQLQMVSLLSPDAPAQMKEKYSPFVTPELLEKWMKAPSAAPGRMVSSPWPDRIEIGAVTERSPAGYLVTGDIIELTSVELANGGAANRIPLSITVENVQGTWLISGYKQKDR